MPAAPPVDIAVIGGSGLYALAGTGAGAEPRDLDTPYGPARLYAESIGGRPVIFLPRHGLKHNTPPHLINYRAQIWALQQAGARRILAVNAVGGIAPGLDPGVLAVPDQIVDYTWGREHSFVDGLSDLSGHVDFTWPYSQPLREQLILACRREGLPVRERAVYGCTQGPRLESAAEIARLARDGCDLVGMTAMPEAALARELGLEYAALALVVNRAAGLTPEPIGIEAIRRVLEVGMGTVRAVLGAAIEALSVRSA